MMPGLRGWAGVLVLCWGAGLPAAAEDLFARVFQQSRQLDPAQVARAGAGERLTLDTNGDGKTDELWYLDTSPRHEIQPLLVRVVDEDGDMGVNSRGDLDSDCYYWDWHADGTVDVVTDYQDNDHDQDVDEMGIFYDKEWNDGQPHLTVWWAVDVGDDNLLWYDVEGTYDQPRCQYRTHFSGDELFYQFRLDEGAPIWINVWEDPFAFYDWDGDRCAEEVVRISAVGHEIKNLRYSMDADNDAYGSRTHDYDFSITAIPDEAGLSPAAEASAPMTIRGIATAPVLTWEHTRKFAQAAPWGQALLTWDELNSNTDGNAAEDPNERWEGILNQASKSGAFPQVGGPPASKWNKRVELATKPQAPLRLYLDTADQRFHLLGASEGYLDVDYNLDGQTDAAYRYADENGDGVLDKRFFDADADGVEDCAWPLAGKSKEFPLEFKGIAAEYTRQTHAALEASRSFVQMAERVLGGLPPKAQAAKEFFATKLADYLPEREVGRRLRETEAGARFYLELMRDWTFVEARRRHGGHEQWSKLERDFSWGDYYTAGQRLHAMAPPAGDETTAIRLGQQAFPEMVRAMIGNPGDTPYFDVPIAIPLDALREKAPDFNPDNCAVLLAYPWVDWVEIPHQMDAFAWDDAAELCFLADLPARSSADFVIAYAPEGKRVPEFPQLTRAVLDTPAYVAWESELGAFRFYTGQFDFFGKQVDRPLPPAERLLYPMVGQDYHTEQPWGIDALHVGKTSGLGGLTLYRGDKEYPVQSPAGEGHVQFSHRVLGAGPVRAAVEIVARNVFPEAPEAEVVLRCLVYAGHRESEIRVRLPKGFEDAQCAPGLLSLAEETPFFDQDAGCLGAWGWQEDGIGDIGLAVMAPPEHIETVIDAPGERRIRCVAQADGFRYWIAGDWRRGRQYPVAPTVDNWKWETARLAGLLRQPQVSLCRPPK